MVHKITVLVADIRGYTSLSEHMPVNRLADMLGRWFGVASEIVETNHGVGVSTDVGIGVTLALVVNHCHYAGLTYQLSPIPLVLLAWVNS